MTQKTTSTLKRFFKGFIGGAIASMIVVAIPNASSFGELSTWFTALGIAGITGGLTGLFLAIQKWSSWNEESTK